MLGQDTRHCLINFCSPDDDFGCGGLGAQLFNSVPVGNKKYFLTSITTCRIQNMHYIFGSSSSNLTKCLTFAPFNYFFYFYDYYFVIYNDYVYFLLPSLRSPSAPFASLSRSLGITQRLFPSLKIHHPLIASLPHLTSHFLRSLSHFLCIPLHFSLSFSFTFSLLLHHERLIMQFFLRKGSDRGSGTKKQS